MKSGMVTGARLISPYYPLLLGLVLVSPGMAEVVRSRWWRSLVWMNFLLALVVLVVAPGRPLWPAQTILSRLQATRPASRAIARPLEVYRVYSMRSDPLANIRDVLPQSESSIGFMGTDDDIDMSLWRPFGARRVEHILVSDSLEEIRCRNIQYVVVGGFNLIQQGTTLAAWLDRTHGKVIATTTAKIKVTEGTQEWFVVRLPGRSD
jgi:hypothetical protein